MISRDDTSPLSPAIPEQVGGLIGFISASFTQPPADMPIYGFSYYTTVWPLIEGNLQQFQIGLPSPWLHPNNNDFNQALLPPHNRIRELAPNQSPWRNLFQSIEGGAGYWGNEHFFGPVPKYRINGTPDGYDTQISSPGWSWGGGPALGRGETCLAQLSNRLLVAPDGLTFCADSNGEVFGTAWMALPLTPPRGGAPVPVGENAWTLFLNTANFKGPTAFWIPDGWTRLSRTWPVDKGRGFDARPGVILQCGMEFNTVPFFRNAARNGIHYTRVPRLSFPVDADGTTYLLQDVIEYPAAALFDRVKSWLSGGAAVNTTFDLQSVFRPVILPNPLSFRQGTTNPIPVNSDAWVQTTPRGSTLGLKWTRQETAGVFPEYYQQSNSPEPQMIAIRAEVVPQETRLPTLAFAPAVTGAPYAPPTAPANSWSNPPPSAGPFTAALADGSVVTYSWYRFIDQPALQGLDWSDEEKAHAQAAAEKIHAAWPATAEFLPAPSRGKLVTLDEAALVTPPAGLEVGYVPVVTRQGAR